MAKTFSKKKTFLFIALPLIFFLFLLDIPLTGRMIWIYVQTGSVPPINFLTAIFVSTMAFFSLLFAMWFDMDCNKSMK